MHISLTWDLLVIIFFAVVCAYSFIVGKDESVKIIISTYIAIVAVQGMGNLVLSIPQEINSFSALFGFSVDTNMMAIGKLLTFVAVIIFLAIRGGFEMEYAKDMGDIVSTLLIGAFGFSTAGLLLTTLLTYIAGRPLLDPTLAGAPALQPLLMDNRLIQIMVEYQNIWFSLPAFLLIIVGFLSQRES